jgi:hypothetical protein
MHLFTMGIAFTLGTVATPEARAPYSMKNMRELRRGVLFAFVAATG